MVYILHFQPFEEPLMNRLEVTTECFTLSLIYLMFCFTGQILSPQSQYTTGYIFTTGLCLCIGVHLFFLFKDIVNKLILHAKRWYNMKRDLLEMSPMDACLLLCERCCKKKEKKAAKVAPIMPQKDQKDPDEELGSKTAFGDINTLQLGRSMETIPNKECLEEEKECDGSQEDSEWEGDESYDVEEEESEQLEDISEDYDLYEAPREEVK